MSRTRRVALLGALASLFTAGAANAQEFAVRSYTNPSFLDMRWGERSFYRQPWRAFLETRSGYDFLQGIGVVYNVNSNDALAARTLAEAGFRSVRFEIGWGLMRWDEAGFTNATRLQQVMRLFRKYGLRPTFLLNGHHGQPCPTQTTQRRVSGDVPTGATALRLDDVRGLVPGRTGLSKLTGYRAAEVFLTRIEAATGVCTLSRPLPVALRAGATVELATLKYRPLFPVGTHAFEETAAGWTRYAIQVCRMARDAGLQDYDLEIWNELTFGSDFLNINNYYEPDIAVFPANTTPLRPGGQNWELAARTIRAVKSQFPEARVIWGFSNITFFHTPLENLPPGTDGQSYHPYGVGTRRFPDQEQMRDKPWLNVDRYTPRMEVRIPEGWAHLFHQTESLMRLINPVARKRAPQGTARFRHYMTEHGVSPLSDLGVRDAQRAWEVKAKVALRSYCLWLNKGIDTLHTYCAYAPDPLGMGLLAPELPKLDANAAFSQAATRPLQAIQNLTRTFVDCVPIAKPRQLDFDVTALGRQSAVFTGNRFAPSLWQRETFAALPFQVNPKRFIIAIYQMSFDVLNPPRPGTYRLTIKNLPNWATFHDYYDPLYNMTAPYKVVHRAANTFTIEIEASDSPRLLLLDIV